VTAVSGNAHCGKSENDPDDEKQHRKPRAFLAFERLRVDAAAQQAGQSQLLQLFQFDRIFPSVFQSVQRAVCCAYFHFGEPCVDRSGSCNDSQKTDVSGQGSEGQPGRGWRCVGGAHLCRGLDDLGKHSAGRGEHDTLNDQHARDALVEQQVLVLDVLAEYIPEFEYLFASFRVHGLAGLLQSE
jgi:hypothetical protein